MASSISRLVLAVAVASLTGCGSGIGNPPAANPQSFSAVRESCRSGVLTYSDDEIATIIDFARADQEAGFSYNQSLQVITDSCSQGWGLGSLEASACIVCGRAAANYVFN